MREARSSERLPCVMNDAVTQKIKSRWDSLQLKARWDAVNQQITKLWHSFVGTIIRWRKRLVYTALAGIALFSVLFLLSVVSTSPTVQTWRKVFAYSRWVRNGGASWAPLATRADEWETHFHVLQLESKDKNWAGLRDLRNHRIGAMAWDDRAEDYFYHRLERTQFPADCSKAHLVAHYDDFTSGILPAVHIFQFPLFFALLRGHPVVPIRSSDDTTAALDGCGSENSQQSMQCFFNVTTCNPKEDETRSAKILAPDQDQITWDEMLMDREDFFTPGGVSVVQTHKGSPWDDQVTIPSSTFASYREAFNYLKLALWNDMGRYGKTRVVSSSNRTCDLPEYLRERRVDMVVTALMSAWMLNRTPTTVKTLADKIMSRYVDANGERKYGTPVLAIHISQTDKAGEDLFFREHNRYRPVKNYAMRMKEMENEFNFKWPSIFVMSDSETAFEQLTTVLNGNDSWAPNEKDKRLVMHDWLLDQSVEHDSQIHFLASLYIVHQIADHAIVTYSSNVGRFIGEVMAAKHQLAHVDRLGPVTTSLDDHWIWV